MDSLRKATLALLLAIVTMFEVTQSEVYHVGDSTGWTILGNVDYEQWAADKTFKVGDVIMFKYNPQYHNVLRVTHANYRSCNATSPIATYKSGNDSIKITTKGHHHLICGVPGHCQIGQKIDINVPRMVSTSSSYEDAGGSVSADPPTAPAPASSGATSLKSVGDGSFAIMSVAMAVMTALV